MFSAFLDTHPFREMIDGMPVCPFPDAKDRAAWEGISPEDRNDLLALYETLKDVPYPMCTASQFMAFVRSGSRKVYEEPYFLRRRKLIASLLQLCITGADAALNDMIDGVWCICEESSWVISAHNINHFDGAVKAKDKPLPEYDDVYVDLFSAQTAMILAHVDALAGEWLDAAAPVIRRRIRHEIERRVITPFMTRDDFWWMGFVRKDLCNWTPWIVSNVFFSASLLMQDRIRYVQLLDRGCRMIDRWLAVMPQDGGCDEGTAYYNMAGGALLDILELLERVTDGKMSLWQNEKLRNILSFPLKTQLGGAWFVNFADCDAKPMLCGERIQLAGEKLGDPALAALGVRHRGMPSEQISDVPHFTRLLARLFHPAPESVQEETAERDVWLPDLQLRVIENSGMILCAKGGHNGESHNHNDVGTFILFADGEPQIVDAGNMTYTAKTFAKERYTLFNTRSAYHNLPLIGGCEQQPGRDFAARNVQRLHDGLMLDIAGAYAEEAGVTALLRTMRLDGGAMTLEDEIVLNKCKPVTWTFMLRHRPQIEGFILTAGNLCMAYDAALDVQTEEIVISDPRMACNFPGSLWRILLTDDASMNHKRKFTITRS